MTRLTTTSRFKSVDRIPPRRDTRPSVCAVCGKPTVGRMVRDELSPSARPKYYGACNDEHAKMIIKGDRPAMRNVAIVNDDSLDFAKKAAGLFIKKQHSYDLREWSPEQSKAFVSAVVRAYLNCEFDNVQEKEDI